MPEQELAYQSKVFLFSEATNFCLKKFKCNAEQEKSWKHDTGMHVPCCKEEGTVDGLAYGESSGGNIAEERWAVGRPTRNIPRIIKDINWKNNWGSRNCMGEPTLDHEVDPSHIHSLEGSQ